MITISFDISDDVLTTLNENADEFIAEMRLFTAQQLFKRGKISIGKAAVLAGMEKYPFITACSKNDIPMVDYDASELNEELFQLNNEIVC